MGVAAGLMLARSCPISMGALAGGGKFDCIGCCGVCMTGGGTDARGAKAGIGVGAGMGAKFWTCFLTASNC